MTKKESAYVSRYDLAAVGLPAIAPTFWASGFDFPDLPVITQDITDRLQAFTWGLIPSFARMEWGIDKTRARNLNARDDKLFDLATWKGPVRHRRCLVVLDGFFEYHHADKKTRVPYHITMANDEPMTLAGLWDEWRDPSIGVRHTVTLVTTRANDTMKAIHNNPDMLKRGGPRMPLILDKDTERIWLSLDATDKAGEDQLKEIMGPFPDESLRYYTVSTLQGKNGTGNSEAAIEPRDWPLIGLP